MLEDRNAPNGLGNSSPVAADDWFDLLHDTTLFANLLWNDYDPDGDTLSITPINGQTYTPGTQITLHNGDLIYGYLTVGQDGSFTFTPTLRYKGQVSFSYTISDGEYESTAWVTINVFNNMPQLGDQEFSMLHDQDLVGNLLSGAYDPDGDAVRITHINGQAISYGEPMSLPSGGSITVWADGTFSYTPPPNFTGTDSFSLTISDDLDSYTAMVNILVTNNAPYAYDASFGVLHDRELTGQLYGYDPDGDTITAQLVSGPTNGTLTFHPDGSFTYTPNTHYVGGDSFTYTWSDGLTSGNAATVVIDVYNNAPYAYDASFSVLHDRELTGQLYGYDPDGDPITAQLVSDPTNGTLTFNPDGTFTYTPNTHYVGPDSFTYTWSDGLTTGNTATVTIDVYNNSPYAYDASFSVLHDRQLTGSVYGYDLDGDAITAQLVSGPTNGTLTFHPDGTFTYTPNTHYVGPDSFTYTWSDGLEENELVTVMIEVYNNAPFAYTEYFTIWYQETLAAQLYPFDPDFDQLTFELESGPSNGMLDLQPSGEFMYTPSAGYTGTDMFVYKVRDGIAEAQGTVFIAVINENDGNDQNNAPNAVNDTYYVLRGSIVYGNVLDNDTDPDGDRLQVVAVNGQPLRMQNGRVVGIQLPSKAILVMNPDGSFLYASDGQQNANDSFTYTVRDVRQNGAREAQATVTVRVAKMRLESVTFSGGHSMYADPTLAPGGALAPDVHYDKDHWFDANGDGDADDPGDYKRPYAYTRNTKLKVSARFVLDQEWHGGDIFVKATGPGGISLGHKKLTVDATDRKKVIFTETEAATRFPDIVKAYVGANMFTLQWQATSYIPTRDSGWLQVGRSENPIYLTYANPAASVRLYHTVVHLGSNNADGKRTEAEVISAIWNDFKDLVVRRVDGTQLRYWDGGRATAVNTQQLLAHANGQCGSWAYFLRDIMLAQGITDVKRVHVFNIDEPVNAAGRPMTPDGLPAETRILVKNWRFGKPTSPATKPYIYRSTDVTEERGVPGQGNDDPPSRFYNHYIVRLKGQYYDPSYGTGPFATQNAWENASLDGFGQDRFSGTFYKKNDPKRIETRFVEL